jgi:hypothetical protein
MNAFNIDHIFVVFGPGSGGNFIAGILEKINSNNLSEVAISQSGSSHSVTPTRLSFGSTPEENIRFNNLEDREKFYIDKIVNDPNLLTKTISWSHDYTNLPLYKKHFKNCRTLTITCYSPIEKLTSILMQVNKVILSNESDIPIPVEIWKFLKERLRYRVNEGLKILLGLDIDTSFIFDNRTSEEFKNLVYYISTLAILRYIGLNDVLIMINESPVNVTPKFNIRDLVSENSDVILPYSYLANNNVELLEQSVSKIFDRELSADEKLFVVSSFIKYRNKQDAELLTDPLLYFNKIKYNALNSIKNIKERYDINEK